MALTFDDVLETLVRTCEAHASFADVAKATIVRDLRGRVRLAVVPAKDKTVDTEALEAQLGRTLGAWFAVPILAPDVTPDLKRVRQQVLEQGVPWTDARYRDLAGGADVIPAAGKWHLIERRLSKLDWLAPRKAVLPWPLVKSKPAVVTFYSFKGGVGRTTLVASTALLLAKEGKRVVVVDLDVEAPGVATLLGAAPTRGLLDFLVDHAALGETSLHGLASQATALDDEAANVSVIGAGVLGPAYFEKLARLDFVGSQVAPTEPSPVTLALRALLSELSQQKPAPDFILLDSRAGLHDVAGLSLHDLAHVDVLVGRDSDQGYLGLELAVMALGRRRSPDDLRCAVVQTMAPDDPASPEYERITAEYRTRSYSAFVEHVYPEEVEDAAESAPDLDDPSAAHHPTVVRFQPRLVSFTSLRTRREELIGADFVQVKERIVELCVPEGSP